MKNRLLVMLVLGVAVAAVLAGTASVAVASPTPPTPGYLGLILSAPGSGVWFGNQFPKNSPLCGTYPQIGSASWRGWYNSTVSFVTTPTFETTGLQPIPYSYLGYSRNGSAFTSMTASVHRGFWAEGVYSFDATGALALTAYEATSSFGVDMTRPVSSGNPVPVYDSSATVGLSATDTLSGAEYIVMTLDTNPEVDFALINPTDHSMIFGTTTPGPHTLRWFAIDNAGNHEFTHIANFVVNPTGYTPVLGKPKASVKKKSVTFTGSVTAAATNRTVVLTVQRKSGSWKPYATYHLTVPMYASSYSLKKSISKTGTYQVRAAEGTGASVWSKSFKIN